MSKCWTPHATVASVIERDGYFLMVEEITGGKCVVNQPAGHIEAGETILAAARRETLEETGWEAEPYALIGLYTYTAPANGVTYHRYCFAAKVVQEREDAELDEGILAPRWMTLEELRTCPNLRSPMVLTCVEDHAAGKHFPLDVITEHP